MRLLFLINLLFLVSIKIFPQGCCSGSSGSPIAGGTSQGVLKERQMEISESYQYLSSNKFQVEDRDTAVLFDQLYS